MVSPAKQISSQQSKRYDLIADEQEGGVEVVDTQSMVECLGVVQLDENQRVQVESPNRALHNIVSHNIDANHSGYSDPDYSNSKRFNGDWWEAQLKADISPRFLKSARKGKKQGNGENILPIRVQPKRVKSKSNKQ
ncbi:hypothetical protein KY284_000311 [Solanum tuberosum]|nr:hypothetical protein KY284_000311 [Solanum tuberosum]